MNTTQLLLTFRSLFEAPSLPSTRRRYPRNTASLAVTALIPVAK